MLCNIERGLMLSFHALSSHTCFYESYNLFYCVTPMLYSFHSAWQEAHLCFWTTYYALYFAFLYYRVH